MVYRRLLSNSPGRPARFLMLALGGALTASTLIFTKLGGFQWITLIPAAVILLGLTNDEKLKLGRAYGYGLYFFMCYFVVIFHWFIRLYPLDFAGLTRGAAVVVVLAGWFGLSLLESLSGGLVFLFTVLISRVPLVRKFPVIKCFVVAALWSIFEWGQTFFWTGVPWGRMTIGQIELPFMVRSTALFGPYFVTFLLVAVNFLLALGLMELKRFRLCSIVAVSLAVVNIACSGISTLIYSTPDKDTITVAAIQGNIASGEKWDMPIDDMIEIYAGLTRAAADEGAELIVWPETAIPISFDRNPERMESFKELAVSCDADILMGLFTHDDETREYNSLVLFRRDGTVSEDIYSKRRLVPFGEFVPMRKVITTIIPPLAEVGMISEDLQPGADSGIIDYYGVDLGSLICFDSIYEELTRTSVNDGAELIVLSTNDSWFFDSAAVYMHNTQARLRAIESNRYVLRSASTGISAVILSTGEVTTMLDPLVDGYIVSEIGVRDTSTLYMKTGNLLIYLAIAFLILLGFSWLPKKLLN